MIAVADPRTVELLTCAFPFLACMANWIMVYVLVLASTPQNPGPSYTSPLSSPPNYHQSSTFRNNEEESRAATVLVLAPKSTPLFTLPHELTFQSQ